MRTVTSPIALQGKSLGLGSTIMIAIRELHSNSEAFGPNVDRFDANRFYGNNLDQSPYFRPFAGGSTYCHGRYLAKRLSLVFVATLLERFEVEIVGKEGEAVEKQGLSAPEIDQVGPHLGIMRPVKGQEVYVRLSERKAP